MKKHRKKISFGCVLLLIISVFVVYHLREYQLNRRTNAFPIKEQTIDSQHNSNTACNKSIYTILSIDGGGVRGIIPLYFLSKIEQATHEPIRQSFDMMAGVSVGALITTQLSLPNYNGFPNFVSPNVLKTYTDIVTNMIYTSSVRKLLSMDGLLSPSYSASIKYDYLKKMYPKDYTVKNLAGTTIIVGFDFKNNRVITFSNCAFCSSTQTNYSLLSILSGATSPLGFFSPQILNQSREKIEYILSDASYSMNDPTMIAYAYGKKICPEQKVKYYFVLSLGTGQFSNQEKDKNRRLYFGVWHWLPGILRSMLQGGRSEIQTIMETADDKKLIYVRINPLLKQKDAYPLTTNPKTFQYYLNASNIIYKDNPDLFQCIAIILKNRVLTAHCSHVLSQYANSRKLDAQIVTNHAVFTERFDSNPAAARKQS